MARDLAAIHRRLDEYERDLVAYYQETYAAQPLRREPSCAAEADPAPSAW